MDKILSLPPNLVGSFHSLTKLPPDEWFVTTDPGGAKVGSGGGTAWAVAQHCAARGCNIDAYLPSAKRIIIHAGGQSRRLPAYAATGKVLTPIPVFRWSVAQPIDQNLLSLQMPLYEHIMQHAHSHQNTLIASGDMLVTAPTMPATLPDADVVCCGVWTTPQLASHHGVFFTKRQTPHILDFMLQKPTHTQIEQLSVSHMYLMDVGIWILSDRAMLALMRKCGWNGAGFKGDAPCFYDLYSTFGTALGQNPTSPDADLGTLSVAIVTLDDGNFYHFGTSAEMISSTEAIQNTVVDQRNIWHKKVKPQASIFVQNAACDFAFSTENRNIWIENSTIAAGWTLTANNILTGIPQNDRSIALADGQCLDMVPVGDDEVCIRAYHIGDKFRGACGDAETTYMGIPLTEWLGARGLSAEAVGIDPTQDIQQAKLFPVLKQRELDQRLIEWILGGSRPQMGTVWTACRRLSADGIMAEANLERLFRQRHNHLTHNLPTFARNYKKSVFYQTDLKNTARLFAENNIALPPALPDNEDALTLMLDSMFRSEVLRSTGDDGHAEARAAFGTLHDTIAATITGPVDPRFTGFSDQIVWGRSPARLDLAGGWTDTPPYCMMRGGKVVNIAVDLNGQPPIQTYIRRSAEPTIVIRSIDNGVAEKISTFEELAEYNKVGSAFSIPKAALCLAGFRPQYCATRYNSLAEQLTSLGGGMEITLFVAIPKGSGLGTSSILAATLLGTLSDFCGLGWDLQQICHRALVLEQLLTTGGGWQDQYGGIFSGLKILESAPGPQTDLSVKWLPDRLFTLPQYSNCWLLYYTGITRVAKNILGEIVRGMFLNEGERIGTLDAMRQHADNMAEAIQTSDFEKTGELLRRSWHYNRHLDPGTTTPEIEAITEQIDHLAAGYKLLGAGGGGYMLICAKNEAAAAEIRRRLESNPQNDKARFVSMTISHEGLQISRS